MIKKRFFLLFSVTLICSFSVFAQNESKSVIKFAYLADTHVSVGSTSVDDLRQSVQDINNLKDVDFVIFAGDITEFGSDSEIRLAKSIIDELSIPYYIVAGNHDAKWSESGCNTFAKVFGYEHFNFEVGGVQFIGCNSGPNMRMAPALVPRESIVWLDSLTKALPKERPVVFVNHYPLDDSMLGYQTVLDFLARTNIQVALCGHGHNNSVLKNLGVREVMGRSNLRAGRAGAGYNLITISDGKITFQERMNGVTKDPWYSLPIVPSKLTESLTVKPTDSSGPVKVVWEVQDNSDIGTAAILAKDVVYYANTAGVVKALDAVSGKLRWSYATSGKIFSTPAIDKGLLVVGSSDDNIYCLDVRHGKLVWKVKAEKSVLASPTIYKGIVYVGSSDGIFRALDLETGRIVWTFDKIKGFVEAKAWVDNDGVYIGDWANTLYAFNPKNGKLLWEWTNGKGRMYSPAAVWPVKTNGKIFFVTPERKTYALDASSGKELWSANGGREAIGLSADKSAIYVKTMQDTVIAFSTKASEAKSLWRSYTGYGYEIAPSPITNAGGLVFIPTDKGNIFALNQKNGAVVWSYNLSIALINYIQPIGNNKLLVSTMDGKVAVLSYLP